MGVKRQVEILINQETRSDLKYRFIRICGRVENGVFGWMVERMPITIKYEIKV